MCQKIEVPLSLRSGGTYAFVYEKCVMKLIQEHLPQVCVISY